MKKLDRNKIQIPDLPYRQGSISFCNNDTLLVYKKMVNGERESVYGVSVGEVMETAVYKITYGKETRYEENYVIIYLPCFGSLSCKTIFCIGSL